MTARPLDPECRRRPLSAAVALVLAMVAVLLAAGCVGQNGDGKQTSTDTIRITNSKETFSTVPGDPEPTPASCPVRQNNSYAIALGDPFVFSGHSQNPNTTMVKIWIFGKNSVEIVNVSRRDDGSFTYSLRGEKTRDRIPGTYHIVVQYPVNGSSFSINPRFEEDLQGVFDPEGHLLFSIRSINEKKVDGLEAAETLEREISKPGISDTSTNATLVWEKPWIHINPIGNHTTGDIIVISGTTNLAAGDEIAYDLKPVDYRLSANARDYVAPTVRVQEGSCGINSWSFGYDSGTFTAKEYYVWADAVLQDANATQWFFLNLPGIQGTSG